MAFMLEEAKVCSGCGTRREEWDEKQGGNRFAYVAEAERCPGCELIEQEHKNVEKTPGGSAGVKVFLRSNRER